MFTESWDECFDTPAEVDNWIWHGFLRPGQVTLMVGLPKAGKTTLVSHILGHRRSGTPLLDRPVRPGVTAVVTEEGRALWHPRRCKLNFGPDVCFFFRPFGVRPTPTEFAALIAQLLDLKARRGLDLVVFDTLAKVLPLRCENSTEAMQEALEPLRTLTDQDLAILLNHHPSKGQSAAGQAARGSGALTAFVDTVLELHLFPGANSTDRRRMLLGFSRNEETPPALMIELNLEGTAYQVLPDEPTLDVPAYWPTLRIVLEDAPEPLTRTQIRDRWAEGCPRPAIRTLWDWLDTACAKKWAASSGSGHTNDPLRYWLPSKMATWLADPLWRIIHRFPEPAEIAPAPPADTPSAAKDEPKADPPPTDLAQPPVADTRSTDLASNAQRAPAVGEEPGTKAPAPQPAPAAEPNRIGNAAEPPAPVKEPTLPTHCSWLAGVLPKAAD